jgi:CRISPR/Cas system-associated exonuclease Cas4 (RecB family)
MIFDGGKMIEQHIAKDYLQNAGYDIVEADRSIDSERSGTLRKLQIGGKLDFVIRKNPLGDPAGFYEKSHTRYHEYPCEVKSMNQFGWEKINSVEDMIASPKPWIKAYPAQLMMYLFGKDYETGLFLLINKATYQPKVIWVQLDYLYTEELLQKAGRINKHVEAGTYPDRIPYDERICGKCDYANVCLDDVTRAQAQIVTDAEAEDRLDELEEMKKKAKPLNDRITELNDWKKKAFDGVEKAIVGGWLVIGRLVKRKGFTVAESESWQVTPKRPGGRK